MSGAAAEVRPGAPRALFPWPLRAVALGVFAASFVFPVQGLGVDLCAFHAATGLPCPGCGLSRAFAAFSRGDFAVALGLNPFVLVFWPACAALAVLALLPGPVVRRVEAPLVPRAAALGRAVVLALAALVGFGALRAAVFLALGERFP